MILSTLSASCVEVQCVEDTHVAAVTGQEASKKVVLHRAPTNGQESQHHRSRCRTDDRNSAVQRSLQLRRAVTVNRRRDSLRRLRHLHSVAVETSKTAGKTTERQNSNREPSLYTRF